MKFFLGGWAAHPGEALLHEEQARNRIIRQLWLEERARALALDRELRALRAEKRARRPDPDT